MTPKMLWFSCSLFRFKLRLLVACKALRFKPTPISGEDLQTQANTNKAGVLKNYPGALKDERQSSQSMMLNNTAN